MRDQPVDRADEMRGFDSPPIHAPRIWSTLFVVRHLAIVAFATAFAAIPSFGDDRFVLAAAVLAVLPYDFTIHLYTRRHARLPRSMPFTYAVIPAVLTAVFPIGWLPAVAATLGNLSLFAVTFHRNVNALSALVSATALGVAGLVAEPEQFAAGLVAYAVTAPAIVLGVGALFDAREQSDRRYRDFVENANDMIYTHDLTSLRFLSANSAALTLTGYGEEELRRITVADIVAPEHLERAAGMIQAKVEGEAEATRYELEIVTKDGRRLPVEVSTRLIRHRGQPVAVQGIARDISDRRHVEAQRAALDRARSEFIANAAHELRTPLTTLAGLAAVLAADREDMTTEELDEALAALARQGRRAHLLADKLLDLSAIEMGGIGVSPEPVSVLDTIGRVLEEAPPPPGVNIDVRVPSDVTVMADPVRLTEVLVNLV
ncbi:MAG TPA: PAS domain-containing sensor histidine kinase, partial [Acidimicrobiia bacterium]|nr:PAS domain-containing sensor histidine kinase [Acidimicrobiia bacterium]